VFLSFDKKNPFKITEEEFYEFCISGHFCRTVKFHNTTFVVRTLSEELAREVFILEEAMTPPELEAYLCSYAVESIFCGGSLKKFPSNSVRENSESLYQTFLDLPYYVVNFLAKYILKISRDMHLLATSLINSERFDDDSLYLRELITDRTNKTFFHYIANFRSDRIKTEEMMNYLWDLEKFQASMHQPKYIQKLEAQEKMRKTGDFDDHQFNELSSLVGEDRAHEIMEKLAEGDINTEGSELEGAYLGGIQDNVTPRNLPVRHGFDEDLEELFSDMPMREKKHVLNQHFLINTPDASLDSHDLAMKRKAEKEFPKIIAYYESKNVKGGREGSIGGETDFTVEKDDKDLLKIPIFKVKRK
jgi:hypothetical protein